MITRRGADLVVESLHALGIDRVFGIPGQNALALFDALRRSSIDVVGVRVENNAAFAADGYTRSTGKVAALFVSTGPGALTALAGLQEAAGSSVPMLVISSQIPSPGLGGARKGMLHELDDQKQSAQNVTKSAVLVRRSAQIPDLIADAYSAAVSAPAGPVWVEIPEDILMGESDIPMVSVLPANPTELPIRSELVEAAASLLHDAQRPVILAGGGVTRSLGGAEALRNIAELIDAPVVATVSGKSALPVDHPLAIGSWVEHRATTDLLDDADVLLAVGTVFGELTSNYFTFEPRGRIIHIDADSRVLESNHPALPIRADAAQALHAIAAHLTKATREGARRAQEVRSAIAQRVSEQNVERELGALDAIRDALPDDTDTYWDMTILGYLAWSAWDARTGGFHTAQGAGGLGYAFPAAIGAATGTGRRTFAVTGDGGAMYSLAELATARQHNAPVTWLIVDDGGYGILRHYMTGRFGEPTATELARPDFVELASAFGIPAAHCTMDDLADTLRSTLTATGPAVVVLPAVLNIFDPDPPAEHTVVPDSADAFSGTPDGNHSLVATSARNHAL